MRLYIVELNIKLCWPKELSFSANSKFLIPSCLHPRDSLRPLIFQTMGSITMQLSQVEIEMVKAFGWIDIRIRKFYFAAKTQ